MKYIVISPFGIVTGSGAIASDDVSLIQVLPGETVVPNVDPPPGQETIYRYVNGAVADTGQPIMPPVVGYLWDNTTFQWYDGRSLDLAKAQQWEKIKSARSDAEYGGFVWDGSTFDSDPLSQQKIIGASQLATLNPNNFSIDWTLKDNTVRTLNATEMNEVGVALGQHVNAQYVKGRTLREQIEAATTKAEVEAVHW